MGGTADDKWSSLDELRAQERTHSSENGGSGRSEGIFLWKKPLPVPKGRQPDDRYACSRFLGKESHLNYPRRMTPGP